MPEVTFTKENLLERNQLSGGWYKLKVVSVEEGPGKNDPTSIVWPMKLVVDDGPQVGTPINHWFSEKAMGRIVDFIRCFLKKGEEIQVGKKYPLHDVVGRHVQGYVAFDPKQGFNTVQDWRPVSV